MKIKLSILIVSYNSRHDLRRILPKLQSEWTTEPPEVLVVDNAPASGDAAMVKKEFPSTNVLEPGKNTMYGGGNNLAMAAATGDWMMILNPDIDWEAGQLHAFADAASAIPNLALAGPRIIQPGGRLQRTAHHRFPSPATIFADFCFPWQQWLLRRAHHPELDSVAAHQHRHQVAHLTGVCLLFPRATYEQTKGFDPNFTLYIEETEWQKRLTDQHQPIWFVADYTVTHYGSTQKRFAQATPHYLWGLRYYVGKHWSGPARQLRLWLIIALAVKASLLFFLMTWPLSWLAGRAGQRLRYYTRQYLQLFGRLITFPTHRPTI